MIRQRLLLVLLGVTTGCAATGQNLKANVYAAGQVNKQQAAAMVEILSVMPAQIQVDNSAQRKQVQTAGAMLGALAGGLGGGLGGLSSGAIAGTTIGGGILGAAAGSLVKDNVLVEGVTLGYRSAAQGHIMTSTQVGRSCEFQRGDALVVATAADETRIQPNATCPGAK
jgi:outer membrane lipoprotein SlyB